MRNFEMQHTMTEHAPVSKLQTQQIALKLIKNSLFRSEVYAL